MTGPDFWDPGLFDRFVPAEEWTYHGRLPNRHREYGIGATVIAQRSSERHERGSYELPFRLLPATMLLAEREQGVLDLAFANPLRTNAVQTRRGTLPLAVDTSAPLGRLVASMEDPSGAENDSFFDPGSQEARRGIYMMQPYECHKIPVLLVHGLWSSPVTWVEVTNEIWGDPELRARYQVWQYLYPTGYGIPFNARALRAQLSKMRADLDPEGDDPAMQGIVVVGHSMGGILSKSLVSESGDTFWNAVASAPFDELVADDETRAVVRQVFFYEPLPFIGRVVFIATPHRGSSLAEGLIGAVGDWTISLPPNVHEFMERVTSRNPDLFKVEAGTDAHSSVDDLSEESVVLSAMTAMPMREDFPFHCIMGDVTGEGPPEATDGVVAYRSSHLDGARSEVVLEGDHSIHTTAAAQLEIRRILKLHLTESKQPARVPGTSTP